MFKKLISITLCTILLLCMTVPAFAASTEPEPTETRTVEDILSDYHEKSFQQKFSANPDQAAPNSRSGSASSKTLEEETVEKLTAAGYEAYNVTGSNYDALEEALNTDFADMGLNRDGSYIIVISGEDTPNGSTNPNSRGGEGPDQDFLDPGGGGDGFAYQYNGNTYIMRFVTITSSDDSDYLQFGSADILNVQTPVSNFTSMLEDALNTTIFFSLDKVTTWDIGTFCGILGLEPIDFVEIYVARLYVNVTARWTRTYTQIKHTETNTWYEFCSVDYLSVVHQFVDNYFSTSINDWVMETENVSSTRYSPHYNDSEWQKRQAAIRWEANNPYHEYVGHAYTYKKSPSGAQTLLFVLYQAQKT